MKCPECGTECKKGTVEAKDTGSLTQLFTAVVWYPDEDKDKAIRKSSVTLRLYGEGYYCDTCMKVYAAFSEK